MDTYLHVDTETKWPQIVIVATQGQEATEIGDRNSGLAIEVARTHPHVTLTEDTPPCHTYTEESGHTHCIHVVDVIIIPACFTLNALVLVSCHMPTITYKWVTLLALKFKVQGSTSC